MPTLISSFGFGLIKRDIIFYVNTGLTLTTVKKKIWLLR